MSTKTTFKRIALVTVAALGFGVLTSVAPASATAGTITGVSVGAATPARVGSATSTTITTKWASAADLAENDTVTVAARVLTAPAGSAMAALTAGVASNSGGAVLAFTGKSGDNGTDGESNEAYTAKVVGAYSYVQTTSRFTALGVTTAGKSVNSVLSFIPDVAGTYTILVSAGDTTFTAGNKSAVWTVTTVGAPASVVLTSINSTVTTTSTRGSLVKVVLKDAAGNVTIPSDTEGLSVTDSSANSAPSVATLSNSDFVTDGFATFTVEDSDNAGTTAYTSVVTVAGDGAVLSAAVNATFTVSFKVAETAVGAINLGDGTAAYTSTVYDDGFAYSSDDAWLSTSDGGSVGTIVMASTANTTASGLGTKYYLLTVTDSASGSITGIASQVYDTVATQAAAATYAFATWSSAVTLADGEVVSITDGTDTVTVTGQDPVFDTYTIETVPTTYAVGSAVTVKALATDQFNNASAYATIAVSVSGRNTVAAKNYVSDADGYVSFTYTDKGTAATIDKIDTVAFGSDDTVAITFGVVTVGTVTVTGGATADLVAYPAVGSTTAAISTAKAGASGATTTFTALVKDASGNLLSGVPVTWTVDKATANH